MTTHSRIPEGDSASQLWPELPYAAWQETNDTLHRWTQIVGKVKLALCPFLNEWWQVTLHLTARGLTSGPIPSPTGIFDVTFDFLDHNLRIHTSDGGVKALPLIPRSVADFYAEFMAALRSLGVSVTIRTTPDEVEDRTPCDVDEVHASYDPEQVGRWWQILLQVSTVLEQYRSPFVGKSSPVQFFWGSFDLAQTRFSGRQAEPPQGASRLMKLAEDQENVAVGFWTGNATLGGPAFYGYLYPEPTGFRDAAVRPEAAHYNPELGEFLLRYDDVRATASPGEQILEFFQSVYEAGATLAQWDRERLERRHPEALPAKESR